jgi:hypothetical protein
MFIVIIPITISYNLRFKIVTSAAALNSVINYMGFSGVYTPI